MDILKRIFHYLANLEWTEKRQEKCTFCDRRNLKNIRYEDETIIVVDNLRKSGTEHFLILPKAHVLRDIEALTPSHLPLLRDMDAVKSRLLAQTCPDVPPSAVHAGYHRGRRRLWGTVFYPDIVSIHHLHLHVIVAPSRVVGFFKYPFWLPLMWKSDVSVVREMEARARKEG